LFPGWFENGRNCKETSTSFKSFIPNEQSWIWKGCLNKCEFLLRNKKKMKNKWNILVVVVVVHDIDGDDDYMIRMMIRISISIWFIQQQIFVHLLMESKLLKGICYNQIKIITFPSRFFVLKKMNVYVYVCDCDCDCDCVWMTSLHPSHSSHLQNEVFDCVDWFVFLCEWLYLF
jgi:hypothetical protein